MTTNPTTLAARLRELADKIYSAKWPSDVSSCIDELEEAAFHLTLLPQNPSDGPLHDALYSLAALSVASAQEYLKALETAPPAFVSNDLIIPASPASGAVYDIPTTGAASTVTLPATAEEGCILHFVADGTKNGHAVTYRDATGPANLTSALAASKRHLTTAIFLNGKWNANAYVSNLAFTYSSN